MIVVDSSVWIDYFLGTSHSAKIELMRLLDSGRSRLIVPDLVLFEVLRGFRHEREHRQARHVLERFGVAATGDHRLALSAAQHHRSLRELGYTTRSAIDVLIAAFCIEHDYFLLHNDRDFEPYAAHRGLRVWGQ